MYAHCYHATKIELLNKKINITLYKQRANDEFEPELNFNKDQFMI